MYCMVSEWLMLVAHCIFSVRHIVTLLLFAVFFKLNFYSNDIDDDDNDDDDDNVMDIFHFYPVIML